MTLKIKIRETIYYENITEYALAIKIITVTEWEELICNCHAQFVSGYALFVAV